MKKITLAFVIFLFFPGSVSPAGRGEVTEDKINIRVDACVSADSIGYLDKGENVQIFEQRFGWCKIRLPQRFTGYVVSEFIEKKDGQEGKVTASCLNLRCRPNSAAAIIGKVDRGQVVYIVGQDQEWLQVKAYPYSYGWVHSKFIRQSSKDKEGEFLPSTAQQLTLSPYEFLLMQEKPQQELVKGEIAAPEEKIFEDKDGACLSFPPQSFTESVAFLSCCSMEKKKPVHDLLVEMGPVIIPRLEERLVEADICTTQSIIYIISRIGRTYPEIALNFLIRIDDLPPFLAAVYLDIVQGIIQPQDGKTVYLDLVRQNKLTAQDIKEAKLLLRKAYNKRFKLFTRKSAAGREAAE